METYNQVTTVQACCSVKNKVYNDQCWAVTSYCNLVTVIILLFAVTSSITNY